jgi:hypothetical protein
MLFIVWHEVVETVVMSDCPRQEAEVKRSGMNLQRVWRKDHIYIRCLFGFQGWEVFFAGA